MGNQSTEYWWSMTCTFFLDHLQMLVCAAGARSAQIWWPIYLSLTRQPLTDNWLCHDLPRHFLSDSVCFCLPRVTWLVMAWDRCYVCWWLNNNTHSRHQCAQRWHYRRCGQMKWNSGRKCEHNLGYHFQRSDTLSTGVLRALLDLDLWLFILSWSAVLGL